MIRLFAGLVALSGLLTASALDTVKINGREAHPSRVLAKYKPGANKARLAAAAPAMDVKREYSEIPGLAVVEVGDPAALKAALGPNAGPAATVEETVKALKATGLFEYVEPDYVVRASLQPTDRAFTDGSLWGLLNTGQRGGVTGADINVVSAWDLITGDTNVIVGVIDTGINYTHRDLAAQMWVNPDETPNNNIDDDADGYIDNIYGINAIADNGDPKDDNGHGSHCAGTIGAAANDSNPHVGVIWKVRLMALKFLSDEGSGFNADAIQCINFSIAKKVKITSNSWGGSGFDRALFDAINAARLNGQIFIAAAGNDGLDNDRFPSYPSNYDLDNIVAVAALDRSDRLADFSNYGVRSVDIGAPGVDIYSTWYDSDTAYNTIDGTSMATPHVAGVAALILAADPTADYLRIRDRLLQRGTPIPALAGKVSTGSRLNAFKALSGQVDNILEVTVNPNSGSYFATNSVTNVFVRVTDDFNVNDATVTGRFNGANITFLNNGTGADTNATDGVYTGPVTMPGSPGFYDLSISVSAPGKNSTNIVVTYEVLPKPANDDFANAQKFPPQGGIRSADNRLATTQPGEPMHAGVPSIRSLWWSWSTPSRTPVVIDTAGTSFDDDAVLGVYTGPSVSTLTEVGSSRASANGPNGTRAPFVKFTAEPNITYWMAVAQTETSTNSPGRVIIRLEPNGDIDTTPPTLRVTNFLSGQFVRTNTVVLAGEANDPPPNASGIRESDGVQYQVNDELLFDTAIGSTNWVTRPIQLTNGWNRIIFKAFDRADNESAPVQFTLYYSPREIPNDLFADAVPLPSNAGSVSGTNSTAAKEFGEPNHGSNEGGHSVWYRFSPSADGIVVLSTEGSSFDTLLALYTVTNSMTDRSVSQLILVAQNDDSPDAGDAGFSELVSAVQGPRPNMPPPIYYIAVDGFGGQTGAVSLSFNFTPLQVRQLTTTAGPGGTITPATGSFPEGSAVTIRALPERYKQLSRFFITDAFGARVSTVNPTTIEMTSDTTVHAEFGDRVFTDDFESGSLNRLNYQISSSPSEGQHWTVGSVQTNTATGGSSRVARVTSAIRDGTTASLVLVTNLNPGVGSFEIGLNTETNYDRVEFLLDGNVLRTWSGVIPWELYEFDIPLKNGPTRLEWRYTKDRALGPSNGPELVGIDNLDLPIAAPLPPGPIHLGFGSTTTELIIIAAGDPNQDFRLESTTDFVNWSPVPGGEANSGTTGTVRFTQPLTAPMRFYRVRQL